MFKRVLSWLSVAKAWVFRLGLRIGPIKDIMYGQHSNIPLCCTLWFISWWRLFFIPNGVRDKYEDLVNESRAKRTGYVECPWCLLVRKSPNLLHICDKSIEECRRYGVDWSRVKVAFKTPYGDGFYYVHVK